VDQLGVTSLALDAEGAPHVTYATEVHYPDYSRQLRYATLAEDNWQSEVVLTAGGANRASLALDTNDVPHVTYYTSPDALAYAYWDAGAWRSEIVDSCNPFRYTCYHALTLDGDGRPHIAYQDNYRLKYARLDAGGWYTETVDSGDSGYAVAIVLDDDGYPHLSYWINYPIFDLLYAYQDESGWHTETIATGLDEPNSATSLALDAGGYPHLTFSWYASATGLRYAYKDAGGWHIESLNGQTGRDATLVLDSAGRPHIGYRGYVTGEGNNRIRYAFKDTGGWHLQSVDQPVGYDGGNISLALDASEAPHLGYYDDTIGRLRYAYWDAGSWHMQTVDDVGTVGQHPSLALDSRWNPHLAYDDVTAGDVKYAYSVDAPPYAFSLSTNGAPPPGYAGSTVTHTFRLTNEGTQRDVYDLDPVGQDWPTALPEAIGPLDAGASATLRVAVDVPTDVPLGAKDEMVLTISSMGDRRQYVEFPLTTYLEPHNLYLPILLAE
jgi:hypothetical protein